MILENLEIHKSSSANRSSSVFFKREKVLTDSIFLESEGTIQRLT